MGYPNPKKAMMEKLLGLIYTDRYDNNKRKTARLFNNRNSPVINELRFVGVFDT